MKTIVNFIGFVSLILIISSCNQNGKPKNFDYGHTENCKYVNSFFGLDILLPESWVVQSKEQNKNLAEEGKKVIAGNNKKLKATLDASDINTANLLTVFEFKVDSTVEYNPSFMLVAENVKVFSDIKTGKDYLKEAKKLFDKSQIKYTSIDNEIKKEVIKNHEYYTLGCTFDYKELTIQQKYYSTVVNGFCLSAIVSYQNEDQENILNGIINSISFKK